MVEVRRSIDQRTYRRVSPTPLARTDRRKSVYNRYCPTGALLCAVLLTSTGGTGNSAQAASDTPEGLLMVSDFGVPADIKVIDPVRNTIVYDYYLDRQDTEGCNQGVVCAPLGIHHANYQDNDYLDMSVMVLNVRADTLSDFAYSFVQRVTPTHDSQVIWKIKNLDFTDVPDGHFYCKQDTEDPSATSQDLRCRFSMLHSFYVRDDRPQDKIVTIVAADMTFERIIQATLDYHDGNTCAHVDWVLGSTHPDWPRLVLPNAVQFIDDGPDGQYLLTTFYLSSIQQWGGGQLVMWKWDGARWQQAWQFPDPRSGAQPYLNTPHMGEVLTDPTTGKRWIWYNHSRGTANDWASYTDFGGSFGLLRPGATLAEKPQYMFDAVLYDCDPDLEVNFSRDVDYMQDGTMLLTDAACESLCGNTGRVFRVAPSFEGITASVKPGYYTPDHSELELLNIPDEEILEEYRCGFTTLFETVWIPAEQMGATLRTAQQNAIKHCPAD